MKLQRLLTVLSIGFFLCHDAHSQTGPPNYYVVIGAFRVLDNAVQFTDQALKKKFDARYAINSEKTLYYVFIHQGTQGREAFLLALKTQVETEYKDAWVFRGALGEQELQPVVQEKPEETVVITEEAKEEPIREEPVIEEPKVEEPKTEEPVVTETAPVDSSLLVKPEEKPKPEGKPFYFRMVNGDTGNPVTGEIHVLESAKATQYQAFRSNELVYLLPPKNRNGVYQLSTIAPGYKEMKRAVNYADPSASAAELGTEQEFIISLPLVRVKTGDYIEFSNVSFFQNSAILRPESKNELDGLLDLLKENPKYKIKIHGHCNGEGNRDIVSKGNSPDFFATSTDNLRENTSAKRLTQLRADIVKEYLVSQGIEADRIQAQGKGGKEMIYPRTSTLSPRNDRVEVEIRKGK